MTDDMMSLRDVVEKTPDADLLREMIGFAAERLMELEGGGRTGAGHGEKDPTRLAQRNGYRERDWEVRVCLPSVRRPARTAGPVELRIPRPRKGSCFPGFLEPRRMAGTALTALAIVSRTNGVPMARSRRPASRASRRARSTTWSRPWGCRASPRARSAACARRPVAG